MKPGPSKRLIFAFWASTLPAVLAACFFYRPWVHQGPVICPLPLFTGIPCPGCGITRATAHLVHGDFAGAFQYHALWPFVLGYFAMLWVYKLLEIARGAPPRWPADRIALGAAAVMFAFWAVRLAAFFAHGGLAVMAHDNLFARLQRVF
jgi:hypothetical protein